MGLLHRARRRLADLINPDGEPEARQTPPAPQGAPPKSPPKAPRDFSTQLGDILSQAGSTAVHAGRINLIGLDNIKERFGASWPRIADRADRITRSTIERHLVPGDIFTAVHGTNYLIIFGSLTRQDAQLKCLLMAREIARVLLGEDGASDLEVRTAVAKLDGTLGFAAAPSIDELLFSPAFDDLPVAVRSAESKAAAEELETVLIGDTPSTENADIFASMRFAYRPMWAPAHGMISAYLCVPLVLTSDTGPVYGEAEPTLRLDTDDVCRLDFAVLSHVIGELRAMVQQRRSLLVTMPVHFETLSSSMRRHNYAREMAAGISPDMANLLLIEIIVPDGVPQSRLLEVISPLRPNCRAMTARARLEIGDLTAFRDLGLLSVGCDIADSSGSEFHLMQRMSRFARAAEKARVSTHIRGIRSLSLLAAALGAGFRYIDGDAISPLVERPRQVLNFSLGDAYRPLVKT